MTEGEKTRVFKIMRTHVTEHETNHQKPTKFIAATENSRARAKERKFKKQILRPPGSRAPQRRRCSPMAVGIRKYENSIRSRCSYASRVGRVAEQSLHGAYYFFYRQNRATESFSLFRLVRSSRDFPTLPAGEDNKIVDRDISKPTISRE